VASRARVHAQHQALRNLPQMHKESVEHTEYEDDLVRETNTDRRYSCLLITNKHVQLASFGDNGTSARMSE